METNKLHPQQAELGAIRESVKEAIITRTLDGIITAWNPAAERIFGYRAAEIVGKSFDVLVPPENREQELEILERIRRGERTEDYDTRRIHKDGRIIEVSVTFSPIRYQSGLILGVVNVENDISDRKRLEMAERDRLFLSVGRRAIVSKDLNGIVTSWNKAAESIFGYTAKEMIGKPIAILIPDSG